jgi:hypothetical protein
MSKVVSQFPSWLFEGLHQCFIFQAFDPVIVAFSFAEKNRVSQIFSIKSQKSLNHKITTRTLWLGKKLWINPRLYSVNYMMEGVT